MIPPQTYLEEYIKGFTSIIGNYQQMINNELNNMPAYSTEELAVINYASWEYMHRSLHNFDILLESSYWSKNIKDQLERLKYEIDQSKIAFNIMKKFGEKYYTQRKIDKMEEAIDNYSKRYQECAEEKQFSDLGSK